ncbi:MAG: hypothetical protein K9K65_08845 [Desulfarculaceae bacterium]|nr:hypothetical protein [Desulfarculaceae bacterium]MCF8045910.1 hypothetical protein [Desulfarculaceae bacterium]MCF8097934.1 hypothetical protein [Desulfarculaceae bacterium]MCF8121113.1 hypothetical protein [Desulfarculaceae bacterium]
MTEMDLQQNKLHQQVITYLKKFHPDWIYSNVLVDAVLQERFGYPIESMLTHQDCPEALAAISEFLSTFSPVQKNDMVESAVAESRLQYERFRIKAPVLE